MNKEEYFAKIKSYKYIANKSLGQNFLIDSNAAQNIVESLDANNDDKVLEIGGGLGSLSYFLNKKDINSVVIDVDDRMISYLHENLKESEHFVIKRENVLKCDLSSYTKIIGNLPYYITSGILEYVLLNAINANKFVFMVQKEVYQKLIDKKEISPLNLLHRYVGEISSSLTVNRNSFTPVPHVDSCYFSFIPNTNIKNENNKDLYKLMVNLFLYRRKTILNSLTNLLKDKNLALDILNELKVDTLKRCEQLDINFYISLLNILKDKSIF